MIAEEYTIEYNPDVSISKNETILLILELMKITVSSFKDYLSLGYHTKTNLNEPELSQTYLQQAQKLIRKLNYPFNIDKEYQDIYHESKGFSDLYFYTNEEKDSNISIFSIECKRLPAPDNIKEREQEYVVGSNNNGGIQRFKTEKHGKGLNHCGMIGFIEKETFQHWQTTINAWIGDLADSDNFWKNDEALSEIPNESQPDDYFVLQSIAHRISVENVFLYHLWINIQ